MIRQHHSPLLLRVRSGAAATLASLLFFSLAAAQQQTPQLDPAVQTPAIMKHLNSVIQFYRSVNLPIQKAGEPNDVIYRDQAITAAAQAASNAFQSARAEAALLAANSPAAAVNGSRSQQLQRIQANLAATESRITQLQNRAAILDREIANASPRALPGLQSQRTQVRAALELAFSMKDAMGRIQKIYSTTNGSGLLADIERVQRSVPEISTAQKAAAPQLITVSSALSAGVSSQVSIIFRLLSTMRDINTLEQSNDRLQQAATELRAPMIAILRGLLQQGQQLSDQAMQAIPAAQTVPPGSKGRHAAPAPATPAGPQPPDLQSITAQFKAVSSATAPLSQEIIILEQNHANLVAWGNAVDEEYDTVFRALLLRLLVILIALAVIIGGGEIWTRATNRYIHDLRRRRQFLIIRRVVVTFLSAIVLIFGFITQFNSLATFAGFITAGIAVGLQTILLSVAAYFFIIGRYGIKVGDRITIASVTGDVIEVGLVRFYLMELAGSGNSLNATGRVAVFSNAVLFQALTPLYKQMPGTGFAWHELTVKFTGRGDYKAVTDAVVHEVQAVYDGYRPAIEHQYETIRRWMHANVPPPAIEARLQFGSSAAQLLVRFPVEIHHTAETDEKLTQALLRAMASDAQLRDGIDGIPTLQPVVRG